MTTREGHIMQSTSTLVEIVWGDDSIPGLSADSRVEVKPAETFHNWTFEQLRKVGLGPFTFKEQESE